jgi:DNA-binding CsgD family transcriptional regulator
VLPAREAFSRVSEPICLIDGSGHVQFVNAMATRVLNCNNAVVGRHHHEIEAFLPRQGEDCIVCGGLQRVEAGDELPSSQLEVSGPDGQCWLYVVRLPLMDTDGVSGLGLILLDRSFVRRWEALSLFLREMLLGSNPFVSRNYLNDTAERESREQQRFPELTAREVEVLHLLAAGLSARDIGRHLGITYNTARNHIQSVLHKLEVHSKVEAVAVAVAYGLVDSGELARLLLGKRALRSSGLERTA